MEEDITILLSEMGLGFAVELSNRAFVIDKGENKWSGTPDKLLEDEDLKSKYLAL
jgi:branched-chain amino acid transport system ATP-binding protein